MRPCIDPIGTAGGINLYAYVNNDAVNATDSLGLAAGTGGSYTAASSPLTGGSSSASVKGTIMTPYGPVQIDTQTSSNSQPQLIAQGHQQGAPNPNDPDYARK